MAITFASIAVSSQILATLLLAVCVISVGLAILARHLLNEKRRISSDFETLMETTPQVLFSIGADGDLLRWNGRLERESGFSASELRTMTVLDFFAEGDRPGVAQSLLDAFDHGVSEAEFDLIRKGLQQLPYEWLFASFRREGRLVGITAVGRDISEKRSTEIQLQNVEDRYRTLFTQLHDAVYVNERGRIIDVNPAALQMFGYSAEEMIGMDAGTLYADISDQIRFVESVDEHCGSIQDFEVSLRTKSGEVIDCLVTATARCNEDDEVIGYHGVIRDVTEQAETRRQLQTIANEWTSTFDAVQSPIILVDEELNIRRLNRSAGQLTGRPFFELLQLPISALPGEPWITAARLAQSTCEQRVSLDTRAEQGEQVWQVFSSLAQFAEGDSRLILVIHDLTLVTQLERSLRNTELASALGALVAGVAHEVRNPLFTISATLDACEARLGDVPGFPRYLGGLRAGVERLSVLMQELLEYGKPHPLAPKQGELDSVAREAVKHCEDLATTRGVHLFFEGAHGSVLFDPGRMLQVLQNLIENAVHHAPRGSTVSVTVSNDPQQMRCAVTDHGPGFSPEDLGRAFEPFYTKRRGGTGLGLAIARKIVVAHGGTITIANGESDGAVVTIALPRSTGQQEP